VFHVTAPQFASTPQGAGCPRRRGLILLFLASIIVSFLAASSAPTPLYALYAARWGFSPLATTVVFGAYALAVLASLLTFGKLSDHVGRRPVILTALVLQAVAMVQFAAAGGLGALLAPGSCRALRPERCWRRPAPRCSIWTDGAERWPTPPRPAPAQQRAR
jgi:MFS family permease